MTSTGTRKQGPSGRLRALARRIVGTPPPSESPTGARIGPNGIPGRLLRVIPEPGTIDQPLEREVSDPSEAAAVRAGWQLIDAHERLSRRGAEKVFGHELAAWHAYAADTVTELEYHLPNGSVLVPESKKNRLRFRRTMDFARQGDNVFDVGFGRGLLAAQLLKDCGVASYHGIDVVDHYVPTATGLFEVNGLSDAPIHLEAGDLFDLTRDQIEATGAKFVICCEVLEHVDDAEKALKTIADALPEGADLLFSVPLHGRLESAWGHLSVFDVARLKQMLDGAGLYAHHVEPLANTWSIVVASKDPAPSTRVRESAGRPRRRVAVPLSQHRAFVDLTAEELTGIGGITTSRRSARVAEARFTSGSGVSFPVSGLESLRVKFVFTGPEKITRFVVTAYAGDTTVGRWVWTPGPGEIRKGIQRYSMRPGEAGFEFVSRQHDGVESADHVDVVLELPDGASAELGFSAAYLP